MSKFYDNLELINLVNKLENVPSLTSLRVNGFCVWPIIRISICFDLISKRYDPNVFIKKNSKKSQLSKIISFFNFFKMKYKIDLVHKFLLSMLYLKFLTDLKNYKQLNSMENLLELILL